VISRAVLIEPILPLPDWYSAQPPGGRPPNSLAGGARKRRAVWPNADALFEAYRTRDTFRTWDESLLRIYVDEGTRARDDGQIELKCPPDLEARFFEAVTKYDPWPSIAELGCPTLVLWGAESHLHGRGLSERLAEALPSSRTALVPGTAHFLPQERPDEVARLMLEFLAD
jgi:pimeloyl-ACP methyl ester carboxylesterase